MSKLPATLTTPFTTRGFTLVEILLTIALIGLTALPFFTAFTKSRSQQELVSATEQFADQLRTAHIFSREQRNSLKWGITIKSPAEYALTSQNRSGIVFEEQSFLLPSGVTFLSPPTTIWFESGSGTRTSPLTVIFTNTHSRVAEAHLFETGLVEVEIVE